MEIVRELIVDALRLGLPVTGAVMGALQAQKKGKSLKKTAGYIAAGYGIGWATGKLVLYVFDQASTAMPTKAAEPIKGFLSTPVAAGPQAVERVAYDSSATLRDQGLAMPEPQAPTPPTSIVKMDPSAMGGMGS